MRIAIIAFYEAWPPKSGAAAVTYNLAKRLPGERLLVQVGRRARATSIEGIRVVTLAGFSKSRAMKLIGLSTRIRNILAEVASFRPDVIILEGASWALYHRMLLTCLRRAVPHIYVVYHSHNVEYDLRSRRNNGAVAAVTRWAESSLLRCADIATAVSPIDQNRFLKLYGVRPVLLANGVDVQWFSKIEPSTRERMRAAYGLGPQTLLFSGFYAYQPNREAIDLLVNSIMPKLRERFRSADLALSGGGAPYREPWIHNAGSVPYENYAAFVTACGIAVAPIFSGSGTRLKILEAMAAGLPVVATEKAVEGLGLLQDEHFLMASNASEFPEVIGRLFEEPALADQLRTSAQKKIAAEFSWPTVVQGIVQLVGQTNLESRRHQGLSAALASDPENRRDKSITELGGVR